MPIATKTQPRPETPFLQPKWLWNYIPQGGIPSRTRCQGLATPQEREAGANLMAEYRKWEDIAAANHIEGKTEKLNQSYRIKTMSGVEQENLRREIQRCDHRKYLEAEAKLAELRKEALAMAQPLFKRLIKGFDDELNDAALAAEQRLDRNGIPLKQGDEWALHDDAICKALWSCRQIAEKTRVEVGQTGDGIGSVQWFLTDEDGVPFQWLN
jgi:hypothetical protein